MEFPDRAAWRSWLQAHHGTSSGIWLAVGKKGNARTALLYEPAVEEALCFGWIDSTVNRLDAERFKQLFTPRRRGSIWSVSNKARVERLTAAGLMTPAGLAAVEAARADGSWSLIDQLDALVIPADLADALRGAGPTLPAAFDALTESQRKQLLYRILTAKRDETRAKRIAEMVSALSAGRSPLA